MPRIRIYIGRHLCTAPRPVKEADALAAAGHTVSVHGLWFDPRLVARDQALLGNRAWTFTPYLDCRPGNPRRAFRWWRQRLAHRLAHEAWLRFKLIVPDVYGYGTRALVRHALKAPADLTIFHSEGGLFAARILRQRGLRTGVDFEDWFSRDLPAAVRGERPLAALAALESEAVQRDTYVLAASAAMARELAATYHGRTPTVIYNTFPAGNDSTACPADRINSTCTSLHWFSQNLGPGRGLETLCDALPRLSFPWELHLRGDDPLHYFPRWLARLPASLHCRVRHHASVSNATLAAHIAQHDVGLALEPGNSPNNDLTVSNKLFQYLQAGLAVVASDTSGHHEILAQNPSMGRLFAPTDPVALANALESFCQDPEHLARTRAAAAHSFRTHYAHELQAHRYADLVDQALGR